MTEDVAVLMEDLSIDKAIVLGHSMGGKIAMTLALTRVRILALFLPKKIKIKIRELKKYYFNHI